MIVYDEIDAHVGGEAAVAVARLLRQQGSKRQVVAITHNPVIAAAADQHFVVNREQAPRRGSHVTEVEGTERESELTRMTTGNLDTSAGLELAKALLKEFQPQKQ
jgi:DNA repair protein RecN (Recombination protein N)